jgi:poly(3-hydroxybutyrate) depolymerase
MPNRRMVRRGAATGGAPDDRMPCDLYDDSRIVQPGLRNDVATWSSLGETGAGAGDEPVFYQLYELNHAALGPFRAAADVTKLYFQNPLNPLTHTHYGRSMAAACEVFERTTRRYGKPTFDIPTTLVGGTRVAVNERVVWERPFCRMVHFERALPPQGRRRDPKVLLVAPMSGHYATLLRGTVEALLPRHEVYITDWIDARMVPLTEGRFDLDDYIDYVISMLHALGGEASVIAVCQPSVPVLAAVSVMEEREDPYIPPAMILMGGPIDTRISPTAVNNLAAEKGLDWFQRNVIMQVPFPHPGFMRAVYPGFLQLGGFMSMNLDRHMTAHKDFYMHLIKGDGDSAEKHRDFYDEYLAVMDLTAEFYLQTVDTVFIRHALPTGTMMHRNGKVDPGAIRNVALLTVEGELDDITGMGQTQAAHTLCHNIPDDRRADYVQQGVGHYGVFNGSRFRSEIAPRITDFILTHEQARRKATAKPVDRPVAAAEISPSKDAAVPPSPPKRGGRPPISLVR